MARRRRGAGDEVVIAPDAVGRTVAVVGTTPDGVPVEERAVRLGPIGLFGIATSPVRTDTRARGSGENDHPTILFLNAGVIDHVGPAGLWVRLGRSWAEAGFTAIRLDLSGNGDSPVHAGQSRKVDLLVPP